MNNYLTRELFELLKSKPTSRDNMLECVQHIHDLEMKAVNITREDYYNAFFSGRLSSVKSIDRIWRKIQEDVPELRGSEWEARQVQSGRIDIEDLSYLKNQLNLF